MTTTRPGAQMSFAAHVRRLNKELVDAERDLELVVDFVEDGQELVDAVLAAVQPFDLILTDHEMPHKNGDLAMEELKAHFQSSDATWRCSMVAVSGNGSEGWLIDRLKDVGATMVLCKPLSRPTLRETLQVHGVL